VWSCQWPVINSSPLISTWEACLLLDSCSDLESSPSALCFISPWLKALCPSAFGTVSLCLPGVKPVGVFGRQVINLITTYLLYAMKSVLVSVLHIIEIVERYVWTVCWQFQVRGELSNCMIKRQNTILANLGLSLLAEAQIEQRGGKCGFPLDQGSPTFRIQCLMIWRGTDIIIDVMYLNHPQTTLPPPPGPWKNCPLVHGAKKFRDCCFGPSGDGTALAVMLEMGRWWNPLPVLPHVSSSLPGTVLLSVEDQWIWVSELRRFQWGVGVSPSPRTVGGCVTNLESLEFWPLLLLCSTSSVHLSSPCLSVLLYCSVGSLLFVCPLPFLHTPNCC